MLAISILKSAFSGTVGRCDAGMGLVKAGVASAGQKLRCLSSFDAIALAIIANMAFSPLAHANPQGGDVVSGSVTFDSSAPDTLIVNQQSDRAIVNWQSFSIGNSEHTQFVQPSTDALIVNRVVGNDVSEILGRLSANGRVMLLNPNGVLFGSEAQVDVNGLIASTLGLTDEQILSGDFSFSTLPGGAGQIVNLGTITAADEGLVALIAPSVRNDGVIGARLGTVALVAGDAVTLDTYGDGLVQFQVDQAAVDTLFDLDGNPVSIQIENSGAINADGGLVLLNAQSLEGVVDSSINMSGLLQAQSVAHQNGEIVLLGGDEGTVLVSGELDATGNGLNESGGRIVVFADRVGAIDGAVLDASGTNGGGTILFGGEFQGQGTDNATRTYVSEDSTFLADALMNGNGGEVIVWSDENTAFYGSLFARGGANGGDGGFAEISGKDNLAYAGAVNLSASNGEGGQILFDPKNIEISLLGAAALSLNDAFSESAALSVTLTPVDILALLSLGTDVTLQANNDLTLTDGLTVNNALGAGGNITLQAGRHVNLNASIVSDDGNISITAGDTNADGGNRDAGIAALSMADGVSLNAGSGNITLIMGDNNGGAINVETLTTTGDVLVRNEGNSGSADILRVSADSLITAGSLAMLTTEAGAAIGSSGSPIRVGVSNLELQLLGAGGGAFLNSPLQGFNIGGAGLGGLTGFDLSGSLELALNGALTQSERVTNSGLITLDVGAGNDITLSHASNDFASVGVGAAADVTLFDVNAIDFGASTISGALNATASGQITDSGAIVVSGATTLSAGLANNITLDNAANNFAGIGVTAAADVELVDTNAIDLSALTVGGDLTVAAGGAITDSGTLNVTGNALLSATVGSDITLNDAANQFGSVRVNTVRDAFIVGLGAVDLGNTNVTRNLTVSAGGAITDSGTVTVGSNTSLNAGAGNNVTLNTAGNDFATVQIGSANDVTLVDTDDVDLGASTISGGLTVTADGAVTDSGALVVAGTTSVTAGAGNNVTLNTAANDFGTILFGSANDVTLVDTDDVDLGASTVSGGLTVTADGAVTDSGALVVAGTTSVTAGAGNNVTLNTAANDFGTILFGSANDVTLVDTDDVDLGASTVSGGLTVTADGAVTDSGALAVTGTTSVMAGAGNNVTLNTAGNDFATVQIGSANDVTLVDTDDVDLGASTVSGGLTVTADGAVTDSGALVVAGTTSVTAGAGNNVTLNTAGNDFATVQIGSANDVTLVDTDDVDLGASTVSGGLTVTADGAVTDSGALVVAGTTSVTAGAGNNVTLNTAGNDFATVQIGSANDVTLVDTDDVDLGASTISGGLTVTADGAVTDSGALVVAGTTSVTAGAGNNVTLNTAGNDFGTILFGSANDVTLVDTDDVDLGASTISGGLTVTADGAVTDSGALVVAGTTSVTAGAGNNVTLNTAGNDFGTILFGSANDVTLVDTDDVDLGASTVSGGLTVTADGAVTDSGALVVAGTTSVTAGAGNNVTLNTAGNDFATVQIGSANDVTLVDTDDVDLGASTISGGLTVTANGAVTDSGALVVAGTTSVTAGAGNNVTLNTAGNDFGTILFGSANDVTLVDTDDVDLGASTISGGLTVTADGAVTDSGALVVAGTTSVTAGAGNNVTLNTAGNDFGTILFGSANDVTLVDTDDVDLGASTVSGGLTVTADGAVTDSGALVVAGTTSVTAGAGNNVTLNTAGNDFATVQIGSANDVTLVDTDDVDLGASTISGGLTVTANGAVSDSGALVVAGTTSVTAGAGNNVTFDTAANDFGTILFGSANDVTLVDTDDVDLGASTISGGLTVTANGGVQVSGAVATNGATSLLADANADGSGDFVIVGGASVSTSGNSLVIQGNDATLTGSIATAGATLVIGASDGGTVGLGDGTGDLALSNAELARISASGTTFGSATSGSIHVDGVTQAASAGLGSVTLDASQGSKTIVIDGTASFFDGLTAAASNGVTVQADVTTSVSGLSIDGDADSAVDGADSIVLDATLTSAGGVTLSAANGDITLAGNSGLVAQSGNITVNDSMDGNFDLTATASNGTVTFVSAAGSGTPLDSVVLQGDSVSGEVHAAQLQINAGGGALTGTVGGQGGAGAAALVENTGSSSITFNTVTVTGSSVASSGGNSPSDPRIVESGHRSGPDAEPSENNQLILQSEETLATRGGVCETGEDVASLETQFGDDATRMVVVRDSTEGAAQFENCTESQYQNNPSVASLP